MGIGNGNSPRFLHLPGSSPPWFFICAGPLCWRSALEPGLGLELPPEILHSGRSGVGRRNWAISLHITHMQATWILRPSAMGLAPPPIRLSSSSTPFSFKPFRSTFFGRGGRAEARLGFDCEQAVEAGRQGRQAACTHVCARPSPGQIRKATSTILKEGVSEMWACMYEQSPDLEGAEGRQFMVCLHVL